MGEGIIYVHYEVHWAHGCFQVRSAAPGPAPPSRWGRTLRGSSWLALRILSEPRLYHNRDHITTPDHIMTPVTYHARYISCPVTRPNRPDPTRPNRPNATRPSRTDPIKTARRDLTRSKPTRTEPTRPDPNQPYLINKMSMCVSVICRTCSA